MIYLLVLGVVAAGLVLLERRERRLLSEDRLRVRAHEQLIRMTMDRHPVERSDWNPHPDWTQAELKKREEIRRRARLN